MAPEAVPTDWAPGEAAEAAATAADCLWDGDCDYATQVEALLTLRRLVEHFTAAVLSTQQDRALDLACLVVPGAACAIAAMTARVARASEHPRFVKWARRGLKKEMSSDSSFASAS